MEVKNFTKELAVMKSVRIRPRDIKIIREGARIEGVSWSDFLRTSGVKRARRVIRQAARERSLIT